MAGKTGVVGNRVTIEDCVYDVRPAGAASAVLMGGGGAVTAVDDRYYSVHDEFGHALGYLRVRGKVIIPDDYGVEGAHPLKMIGRLWGAENLNKDKPSAVVSKGVCRIAMHEAPSDPDLESARVHRAWLKKQPGIKASYLVRDPGTGKAVSISIWHTRAQLDAAENAAGAEGVALTAASVDVFPFVEEP